MYKLVYIVLRYIIVHISSSTLGTYILVYINSTTLGIYCIPTTAGRISGIVSLSSYNKETHLRQSIDYIIGSILDESYIIIIY